MDHCPENRCTEPMVWPIGVSEGAVSADPIGKEQRECIRMGRSSSNSTRKQYSVGLGRKEGSNVLATTTQNSPYRTNKPFLRVSSFNKAKSPLVERNFQARAINSRNAELSDKQKEACCTLKVVKNKKGSTVEPPQQPERRGSDSSNNSSQENKPPIDNSNDQDLSSPGITQFGFPQESDENVPEVKKVQSILKSPATSPTSSDDRNEKSKSKTRKSNNSKTIVVKVSKPKSKKDEKKKLSVSTSKIASNDQVGIMPENSKDHTPKGTTPTSLSADNALDLQLPSAYPQKRTVSFAAENIYIDPSIAPDTRSESGTINTDNTSTGTESKTSVTSKSTVDTTDTSNTIQKAGKVMIKALGVGTYALGEKMDLCLSPTLSDMESQPSLRPFYKSTDQYLSQSTSENSSASGQKMKGFFKEICCGTSTRAEI